MSLSLDETVGLNHRYHDIQKMKFKRYMYCKPPVYRRLIILVTKENH